MGAALPNGYGGGVPLVAFWTAQVGMAIGHLETRPLALSIPVRVAEDQRPRTAVRLLPELTLQPGESYSTPRTFVMVYSGDFYEPLRTYSLALQGRGWKLPKPSQGLRDQLVRLGLPVQRDSRADAGRGSEAQGVPH